MMLIRFKEITDANILIHTNNTNENRHPATIIVYFFIRIISINSYIGIGLTHSCIGIIFKNIDNMLVIMKS